VPFLLVAGAVFLLASFAFLPKLASEKKPGRRAGGTGSGRRAGVAGNPVAWKEKVSAMKPRTVWFALCLIQAVLLGVYLAVAGYFTGRPLPRSAVTDVLTVILCGYGGFFAADLFGSAARSFARERRQGTLDLLVLSTLTDAEIILGKLWGALRPRLPWLVGCVIVLALVLGRVDPLAAPYFGSPPAVVAGFLSLLFAFACVALYASLCLRGAFALGVTGVAVLLWHVMARPYAGYAVVLHLVIAYVFLAKLFNRLKQVSRREHAWAAAETAL
jgi:hypothetical protein